MRRPYGPCLPMAIRLSSKGAWNGGIDLGFAKEGKGSRCLPLSRRRVRFLLLLRRSHVVVIIDVNDLVVTTVALHMYIFSLYVILVRAKEISEPNFRVYVT